MMCLVCVHVCRWRKDLWPSVRNTRIASLVLQLETLTVAGVSWRESEYQATLHITGGYFWNANLKELEFFLCFLIGVACVLTVATVQGKAAGFGALTRGRSV